ncbi:MAG: hypothetical protein GY756_17425 [bacterium]|nr:hypothetical protein [bacterium]
MKYDRFLTCKKGIKLNVFCLIIFMLFYSNSFFADVIKQNEPLNVKNKPATKKKFSGVYGSNLNMGDSFDYSKQNVREFELKPLTHDQQFKKGLDTDRYEILIKGWLNYKYNNDFSDDTWASKYFIKALAQCTYSMNGTLPAKDFNEVLKGRKTYFVANNYIKALKVKPEIKYALNKLYAAACIYSRKVKSLKYSLNKIKKIPSNSILYRIPIIGENESGVKLENALKKIRAESTLGDYVGTAHGENLYYICASYYDGFMNMPLNQQIQFINTVYSYNPTLMLAPNIKRNYFLYGYIKQLIFPEKTPEALKYCLRGEVNWLILPPTLKQKSEKKEQ